MKNRSHLFQKGNQWGKKGGKASLARLQKLIAQEKISERAQMLIDMQSILALGGVKIFKKIRNVPVENAKGKVTKYDWGKFEIVEKNEEISAYLDWAYSGGEAVNTDVCYYNVVVKEPNLRAIEGLLNRIWGPPAQVEVQEDPIEVMEEERERYNGALQAYLKDLKNDKKPTRNRKNSTK